MASVTLTAENFESTVLAEGIVLVDCWAAWCGPCRMFGPIFEEASEARPHITFGKVDTEAEQGLAAALNISSIPTLMIFRDGILLYSEAGALPAPALAGIIDQVEELDMDEVRADIARMQSAVPQA